MKTRKGIGHYKLPPFGQVLNVVHRDSEGRHLILPQQQRPSGSKKRGTPRYFSVIEHFLYLEPIPDRRIEIVVRYYPPIEEF